VVWVEVVVWVAVVKSKSELTKETKMTYNVDLKKPIAITQISFEMIQQDDIYQDRPDANDEGFWPSLDKAAPGYVGENPTVPFIVQMQAASDRMAAWENDEWRFIGIRAKAEIKVPIGGNSITTYSLMSAGLWGIESDAPDSYKKEIFEDQKEELRSHIEAMSDHEIV
jgi:hypothetical protein